MQDSSSKGKPRFFQFSLRSMFIMMTLCAVFFTMLPSLMVAYCEWREMLARRAGERVALEILKELKELAEYTSCFPPLPTDQDAGVRRPDDQHADDPLYVGQHEEGQSVTWINVAQFNALNDMSDAGERITKCLMNENIDPFIAGSRASKVYVMPEDATQAKKLIAQLVKEYDLEVFVEP